MLLKTTRFVSFFCATLALGLTLAHDLEIPGKQQLNGVEWLVVQHTFYGGFAIVAGLAQIVGLISTGYLLFLLRQQRTALVLTLIATLSFAGMLALFAFGNNPLNQQIATWTPQSLPANWHGMRYVMPGIASMLPVLPSQLSRSLYYSLPCCGRYLPCFRHERHRRKERRRGWLDDLFCRHHFDYS